MSVDLVCQVPAALSLLPLFHVCNATYKVVNHQPIGVHVLLPRVRPSGMRPLLVRIHGGGFTEGTSDSWLRPWILELALKHGAILVTPDYRLRPEAELSDAIADLRDFWDWVQVGLPQVPGVKVDTDDLAIVGESAGGTMTAQSALLGMVHPIRVIVMQYPALGIRSHLEWLESWPQKVPVSVLEHHMANTIPGLVVTRAANGSRDVLMMSMMQNGRFASVERDTYLDPMRSLETAGPLPPVLLFHGRQDTGVRVSDSEAWADKLKKLQPDVPLHLAFPNGDHCFDQSDALATPWLQEPIAFVERYWPAKP